MSTSAGKPVSTSSTGATGRIDKGKGKSTQDEDHVMGDQDEEEEEEEEEEESSEEEEEEGSEDEDMEEEETFEEIDPTAIVSGRRARKPVDYSSSEAWAKAGIKQSDDDKDE